MEEQVEVLLLVQLEYKAEKREVQKLKELRILHAKLSPTRDERRAEKDLFAV